MTYGRSLAAARDGDAGKNASISKLKKGKYMSTISNRVIEILDLDVRMILETGKPRNGLVLYRYMGSTVLRIATKLWFVEILSSSKPRFVPYLEVEAFTEV